MIIHYALVRCSRVHRIRIHGRSLVPIAHVAILVLVLAPARCTRHREVVDHARTIFTSRKNIAHAGLVNIKAT